MLDPEYFNTICDKCFLNATTNNIKDKQTIKTNKDKSKDKSKEKSSESNDILYVPKISECNLFLNSNHNLTQLRYLTKQYKLKVTGTKPQLISRIYSFLFTSFNSVKIQKVFRGFIQRKYNSCRGPAVHNRRICTNDTDFFTMDELSELPDTQFFSFKDTDGFIYGFDLVSFYNLLYKTNGQIKNPYNRLPISDRIIKDFNTQLCLSKLLKIPICVEIKDVTMELSKAKNVELKAVALFQNIDSLGNYSNPKWFMDLNRIQLLKMFREIIDIWTYRAHLTNEVKRNICPPIGRPFPQVINFYYLQTTEELDDVRKYILNVLEKLVISGVDKDSKCLGAYYVLGALTLVSADAANALPWLYQALVHV
jgi:hypothetical protein